MQRVPRKFKTHYLGQHLAKLFIVPTIHDHPLFLLGQKSTWMHDHWSSYNFQIQIIGIDTSGSKVKHWPDQPFGHLHQSHFIQLLITFEPLVSFEPMISYWNKIMKMRLFSHWFLAYKKKFAMKCQSGK